MVRTLLKNDIKEIVWETYIDYLNLHNHFNDSHTRSPYCSTLGPYKSTSINPKYKFYGLFDKKNLIGVTSLQEFDHRVIPQNSIRYRVLRINKEYRGRDLGWHFLSKCLSYWNKIFIFGYIAKHHIPWAKKHNFKRLDNPTDDGHVLMIRSV